MREVVSAKISVDGEVSQHIAQLFECVLMQYDLEGKSETKLKTQISLFLTMKMLCVTASRQLLTRSVRYKKFVNDPIPKKYRPISQHQYDTLTF